MRTIILNRINLRIYIWMVLLITTLACNSSMPTIRIKSDPTGGFFKAAEDSILTNNAGDIEKAIRLEVNKGLTSDQLLNKANLVLNFFVKAQEFFVEGDFVEAENNAILSLEALYSNESMDLLINIYEIQGLDNKKDSCLLVKKAKSISLSKTDAR